MEKNPMLEPEYIDRKKLLGKQKIIDGEPYVRLWDLLMAPVEDVAPVVHGRWKREPPIALGGVTWDYCSVCGSTQGIKWMKYRPNCGARMDGES